MDHLTNWQKILAPKAHDFEELFDRLKYRLHERLGGHDPIKIIPYRGFGHPQRLYLKGRVLEDPGVGLSQSNDNLWDNLLNMYRRFESDEVPFARIKARHASFEQVVQANEEGYFEVWVEPDPPVEPAGIWETIQFELLGPEAGRQAQPVEAKGEVLIPSVTAQYAVISDIDDTVVLSDATHMLKMARHVFLGNARTRMPFPGVAALYRALHAGSRGNEQNPLFFLSSSPWNIYDLLMEFFQLQEIPNPVLFLRDWGLTENELLPLENRDHKLAIIHQILDTYPNLAFILIGDSGQQDPEIYSEVVDNYPNRVLAVYIRNVTRDLARPAAIRELAEKVLHEGSSLVLADDSLGIAQHAYEKGWIAAQSFPDIHIEKEKDQAPPTPLENLLGKTEKGKAPTVVVKGEAGKSTQTDVQEGAIESALEEGNEKKDQAPPTVVIEPEEEDKT